jgi:PPIC-type PPIASE domain
MNSKLQMLLVSATWLLTLCAGSAGAQDSQLPPGIVARQGGAVVSLQDVDAYARKIPEPDRAGYFDSPKRIESMIMSLLLEKQLAAEARQDKLDASADVQFQIQQAGEEVLARVAMEDFRKKLKMPDFGALAQEYYASHKAEFVVRGTVDVKHVLVSSKDRSDADAKARIEEVAAAAHAHPDQFDALVEKYSDDPSKTDNHGLIEDAASNKTVVQFSQAAAALKKPGELSPVTKTQFGYHVLQLVARKPDTPGAFADVREALIDKLRKDYVEQEITNHTSKLRGGALEANTELVASIRSRFLPEGVKVLPSQVATEMNQAVLKQAQEREDAKRKAQESR